MSGLFKDAWSYFFGKSMVVMDMSNTQLCEALEQTKETLTDETDVILLTEAIDRLNVAELTETEDIGRN